MLLRIGEIRSILPQSVRVMCLTATATREIQKHVITILGLKNPKVIAVSPSKANIVYKVKLEDDLIKLVMPLVDKLKD